MMEKYLTIREMCDAFNVTARTLRFYEAKELLFPVREGQKRLFTKRDQARLTLILRGKRFGFSLEDIRQLLDLYDMENGEHRQLEASVQMAEQRVEEMEEQRAELATAITELKAQIDWGKGTLADNGMKQAAE
ncbi:MerR family transcriptional regulator [Vannielia litorea]|uniref:MerR family transcriptional regulator n=1 Tax=Vannielia litorea TaxID=1217970 RepID=UPI001C979362|nr:MerR family DNA-binding transcriptional regulator [Vannielia litorea]MBY6050043.1 MerR family DNA-binding transcriptional regulator [Vannielia litorea]MBY6077457.1 MerR family DNA-binding transcriptional regulator [Vannielia litorea]